jgi:hypothetical protein
MGAGERFKIEALKIRPLPGKSQTLSFLERMDRYLYELMAISEILLTKSDEKCHRSGQHQRFFSLLQEYR